MRAYLCDTLGDSKSIRVVLITFIPSWKIKRAKLYDAMKFLLGFRRFLLLSSYFVRELVKTSAYS